MDTRAVLLSAVIVTGAYFALARRAAYALPFVPMEIDVTPTAAPVADEVRDPAPLLSVIDTIEDFSPVEFVTSIAGGEPVWLQRFNASPYVGIVEAASDVSQLPAGLLARLLWQESRYNPAAYNKGSKASGIAQIVPRWHPDVDPWNPDDAIPYAARYLRHLFDRFGSWRLALAGYNWGPGNLAKFGIDAAPAETLDYFGSILADVNDRYQSGLA